MALPVAWSLELLPTTTPAPVLKAMVLPAPAAVPPTVLFEEPYDDLHARPGVGQGVRPRDVGADEVPLDRVAVGVVGDEDAGPVARDEVAGPGRRAADRVARRAVADADALAVGQGDRPGRVRADEVALRHAVVRPAELDAVAGHAADHVAGPGDGPADRVVGGVVGDHAVAGVVQRSRSPRRSGRRSCPRPGCPRRRRPGRCPG